MSLAGPRCIPVCIAYLSEHLTYQNTQMPESGLLAERTFQSNMVRATISACQVNRATDRHLEILPVTLSAAKGLTRRTERSFASLRMTCPNTAQVLSREVLSPNVWATETVQTCMVYLPRGSPQLLLIGIV